ncbi:ankyrin repeat domain-containing protein 50-like [Magallana gigas]|uniref:ankyrin repeat domain-containing protein 50-like n=1 Tax=Magallana gigas TaxID=29159 RepID=UPI00333F8240
MCVFNDPLGKESFDEILNNSWQTYEEELKLYLKTAKLVMSSRNHIIFDTRVTHNLVNQSHIVNIDDDKYKLSVNEKRQILAIYTSDMNLSDKDCDEIVEVEMYFPLLCKLYSSKDDYKNMGIGFFKEPVTVLKEEIIGFRKKDIGKYCALALLVLFNDDLCVSDLLNNKDTEKKIKHTLKLCGLPKNTPPSVIGDNLNSIKDFFVKKIGDTYHFYHDFVNEVTTHVFGTDYPTSTIKYADIGFLRRRVGLENCQKHKDSFAIYLSDRYTEDLGERLFTELFGERLVDVVLNPCLRNKKIIKVLKKKIADHPENIQMFLEPKKIKIDEQELYRTSKDLILSKLSFLNLENEVSPLFALIVFCHTQLSQYCINTLQQRQIDLTSFSLIPAMYCNGSIELFNNVFKGHAEKPLKKTWGEVFPIHIVSVFHNYELLDELIKSGANVNQKTDDCECFTPLMLASGNETQENGNYNHGESGATRRDKTVEILLRNGADINLCSEHGVTPLIVACFKGHDSTVKLLLNEVEINSRQKNVDILLFIACLQGHNITVQLLLSNGADINSCDKDGTSPLSAACRNGNDRTVHLLLNKGADINLCGKDGASPLYAACQNGHNITIQILLSNGADINLCDTDGISPLHEACHYGHTRTVQLLLSNGANINLCQKNGTSPLFTACQEGHDNIVKLLLSNGADINLYMKSGASPLYVACQEGLHSTVKLLLKNEIDFDLCDQFGASPLNAASRNGHNSTVQLLLSNGANIDLCQNNGASPLHEDCCNGHESIVQLLLSNGADINLCQKNGASPLHAACFNGHVSTVQLLLSNGVDINQCMESRTSPLFFAWQN